MADYWTTPKVNWVDTDGIGYEDLNGIEANISANRDANRRKVQGLGYSVNNTPADGVVTVNPGSCYSSDGIPMERLTSMAKDLNAWVQGTGNGGLASGASTAADKWYYIFLIMDPTDGSTDIMIDDNAAGTNVVSGIFTVKRLVNTIRGRSVSAGDLKFVEMFSTGDRVFINPSSMYTAREINYGTLVIDDNIYKERVLEGLSGLDGYALPAKEVRAVLNVFAYDLVALGFISDFSGLHTLPGAFEAAGQYTTEILVIPNYLAGTAAQTELQYMCDTFEIMVGNDRKINVAYKKSTSGGFGYVRVAVVGYHDDRYP